MDLSAVTPFRQKVYTALLEVPAGKVITYAALGKRIECGSAQAIGQAMRHNPFAPEVPCHRVIKSDLTIGGYLGELGGEELSKKLRLLESEGVFFDEVGKIVDSLRAICE